MNTLALIELCQHLDDAVKAELIDQFDPDKALVAERLNYWRYWMIATPDPENSVMRQWRMLSLDKKQLFLGFCT